MHQTTKLLLYCDKPFLQIQICCFRAGMYLDIKYADMMLLHLL